MNGNLYWLWLAQGLSYGGRSLKKILKAFQTPENFYQASEQEWKELGLPAGEVSRLREHSLVKAKETMGLCQSKGIFMITPGDGVYPDRLFEISNPPALLYVQGNLPDVDETLSLAIVGSRKASDYGIENAKKIGFSLAAAGAVVVSGGAYGVDSAGLQGALEASGRTIAVLGGGVDRDYPSSFSPIRTKILQHGGAVVSEYPPGERPYPGNFPIRNRIIAGLSAGVAITEAAFKSGSLITARLALEENRDLFAVPGSVDSVLSKGANALIQQGAKAVTCGEDILEDYADTYILKVKAERPVKRTSFNQPEKREAPALPDEVGFSQAARQLYRQLSEKPTHLDRLCQKAGLSPGAVLAAVTELELQGVIQAFPGKRYSLPESIQQ